jgi:hypothetical protein
MAGSSHEEGKLVHVHDVGAKSDITIQGEDIRRDWRQLPHNVFLPLADSLPF